MSKQKQNLENVLDKICRDLKLKRNERSVVGVAQNGIFVTETLVAAARNLKADLMIVGTHGAIGSNFLEALVQKTASGRSVRQVS